MRNKHNQSKKYVGFTIRSLDRRKYEHFNTCGKKSSNYLFHKAISKYGENSFTWEILFESEDEKYTLEVMENCFIHFFESHKSQNGYNMTWGGEGMLGYNHSIETKNKISKSHIGKKHSKESKKKMSESQKGKILSQKTRNKISLSLKNNNHKQTKETREKMSLAAQKNRTDEYRKKMSSIITGIKRSSETKNKISSSLKLYHQKLNWCRKREFNPHGLSATGF